MKRITSLLPIALTLVAIDAPGPLRVTARVSPGSYLVGQVIEVEVEVDVEPGPGTPTIEAPKIAGAAIFPMATDETSPRLTRFVVVLERSGSIELPPFRARSGDRSGASKPSRLTVKNVPVEGRTSAFLGGVGSFSVHSEVEPLSVRAGQTLEFRVQVIGPASYASVRAPDLNGWSIPGLRVEPLENLFQAGATPGRTFRYRLRASKPGRIVLPPVMVAAIDPKTRRYETKTTSSLSIRVDEPPRLDLGRLDYRPTMNPTPGPRLARLIWIVGAVAVALSLGITAWLAARRRRQARPIDPRAVARSLSSGLPNEDVVDEVEAARLVVEALTEFLHRVDGRPAGVLTPPEARSNFARVTGDPGVASLAEVLVIRADRIRYGRGGDGASGMIAEGRRVFGRIAEGGPGEAVEAASGLSSGGRGLPPVSDL